MLAFFFFFFFFLQPSAIVGGAVGVCAVVACLLARLPFLLQMYTCPALYVMYVAVLLVNLAGFKTGVLCFQKINLKNGYGPQSKIYVCKIYSGVKFCGASFVGGGGGGGGQASSSIAFHCLGE